MSRTLLRGGIATVAAASAYAEAARRATNVAERDHLMRQAARARAADPTGRRHGQQHPDDRL
jgi:hypothetical protein